MAAKYKFSIDVFTDNYGQIVSFPFKIEFNDLDLAQKKTPLDYIKTVTFEIYKLISRELFLTYKYIDSLTPVEHRNRAQFIKNFEIYLDYIDTDDNLIPFAVSSDLLTKQKILSFHSKICNNKRNLTLDEFVNEITTETINNQKTVDDTINIYTPDYCLFFGVDSKIKKLDNSVDIIIEFRSAVMNFNICFNSINWYYMIEKIKAFGSII